MPTFRKKHIEIEAEQFWPGKPVPFGERGTYVKCSATNRWYVRTSMGQRLLLKPGDWVVIERGRDHPAYVLKDDIFQMLYEGIEAPSR